jgi:hypothetical protein
MITAEEGTIQEVEDTIDCQEQLEQVRQFFDVLCLEYQGTEVLSGKDKKGAFETILDNLTDQDTLVGFGVFVFIAQVTQQRQITQIEGILKKKSTRSILRRKQEDQRHRRTRTSA